jgi:O-antigen ligase
MIGERIGKIFWVTLSTIIVAELLSLWGWHQPEIGKIIFAVITIGTFIIACWRLEVGIWIVFSELIIGSKGYLLAWPIGGFNLSIRLAIFCALVLAWIIIRIRSRNLPFIHASSFRNYIWLIAYLILGVLLGIIYHNRPSDIFYDVNGYLYLGLLPVMYDALRTRKNVSDIFQVFWAAIVAIFLKTIILLFLFAGQFDFLFQVYRWVRDTRINEITILAGNAYRIFSQSQIYGLFGFFIALAVITISKRNWPFRRWWLFLFMVCGVIVLVSYSRSFWLALLATIILWLVYLFRYGSFVKKSIIKHIGWLMMILVGELVVILLIIKLPNILQLNSNTASLGSLVEERLSNDKQAGLQSRWNLLTPLAAKIVHQPILGQGFGSTVTYESKDPRINKATNGGTYTTYAFEWGYLDMLLKIGLVGLIIYGLFIYRIFRLGITAWHRAGEFDRPVILGLLLALVALILTHITTPYLNHPLGFGMLILALVIFERLTHDQPKSI